MAIIGRLKVYQVKSKPCNLRLYFQQSVVDVLGSHVVLDLKNLKIRRPTIDDDRTNSIQHLFTSAYMTEDQDKYVGSYNVHQKDEDTFKLKKIKNGLSEPD